jgi:hypothetical protein
VNIVEVLPATPGQFVGTASFDYGTALNPILFQGAVLADFDLYDNTNAAPFAITGVSESPAGTYTVLAAFNTGDSYTLSVNKAGFIGSVTFTAA